MEAKEFLQAHYNASVSKEEINFGDWQPITMLSSDLIHIMVEFAKLHVEKSLTSACKDARLITVYDTGDWEINKKKTILDKSNRKMIIRVDKESILESYPLDNIK